MDTYGHLFPATPRSSAARPSTRPSGSNWRYWTGTGGPGDREHAGQRGAADESACRPGSVHPLARAGGHPSRTAVAGSLKRSTREHRAGHPQSLAQDTRISAVPSDLAPGGVYLAAQVALRAGGLLHRRFTLTPGLRRRRSVFCGTVPRVTPGRRYRPPCPWSPDLPRRASGLARRGRPADSSVADTQDIRYGTDTAKTRNPISNETGRAGSAGFVASAARLPAG